MRCSPPSSSPGVGARVFTGPAAASGARPPDRVLDVGCGTGYFTRVMTEAVAPGGTAHGVDPSDAAIAYARGLTRLVNRTFSDGIAEASPRPTARTTPWSAA
jgi:predicted methyltransferase